MNPVKRKEKRSARKAAIRKQNTYRIRGNAQRQRDVRYHTLRNAAIDAAHEYLAEGKTPEEAEQLVRKELISMAKSVSRRKKE